MLNSHAPVLMGQFSDWIQHLYACEVLSIQGQVHAGPGPVGVYEVDPWPAHRYLLNGHVMLMNAPVQPIFISVAAGQGCRNIHYGVNDIVADIRALHVSLPVAEEIWQAYTGRRRAPTAAALTRNGRSALLLIRRQLMNINVGANTMNG